MRCSVRRRCNVLVLRCSSLARSCIPGRRPASSCFRISFACSLKLWSNLVNTTFRSGFPAEVEGIDRALDSHLESINRFEKIFPRLFVPWPSGQSLKGDVGNEMDFSDIAHPLFPWYYRFELNPPGQ